MFEFLLCLSLVIFVAGVVYAVRLKKENRIPWQSFLLIILIVTAVAMWLAVLPLVEEGSVIYKPLYAAFYVLESAVGDVDYSLFSEALEKISFWRIYTILLHLLMPATAYGVILLAFLKAFGWFKYTIFRGNMKIILFSDLTGKSKAYAKRINSKDTLMIFCNTDEEEIKSFDEGSTRNMIFTAQTEHQVLRQLKRRNLTIMEMSADEDRNVQKSVEIIRYLTEENPVSPEDGKTIEIYTVSGRPEAATIVDNIMRRGTDEEPLDPRLTLINEEKRITFKLLHESPLYEKIDKDTGRLDIMIVGFGSMGQEILKGISWAGCFPDVDTNVHIIDSQSIENGRRLCSECPELGVDLRHSGGFLKPEKGVQLDPDAPIYYYSAETDSPEFDEIVKDLMQCRYIVVSLDDDAATLAAALRIYRLIKRERLLNDLPDEDLEIHVRMRDDDNLHLFSAKEDRSVMNHIRQFGSDEDIYSDDQVGQTVLDRLAERAREVYRDEHNKKGDEKTEYAYLPEAEKNANMTAALHVLYKLDFFKNIAVEKPEETPPESEWERIEKENQKIYDELVSKEERLEVSDWEHIRWQAYMRTEGYVHCPYEKTEKIYKRKYKGDMKKAVQETRAVLRDARMHPCIGDDAHLQKISLLIGDPKDPYYFHRNDRRFVNSIPEILGGVYKLVPAKKG